MLTKILIDRESALNWELEEKLLKICNGFEVEKQDLVLWVVQDLDYILSLLEEAKVSFKVLTIQ